MQRSRHCNIYNIPHPISKFETCKRSRKHEGERKICKGYILKNRMQTKNGKKEKLRKGQRISLKTDTLQSKIFSKKKGN